MSKPRYAVATLLYTTEYLPGVFTLGYQLNKILRNRKEVATCLVISKDLYNNTMSDLSKKLLRRLYDYIYEVNPLDDHEYCVRKNAENLKLLGRPELSFTLIKARLWELTQFDQVLYLDGDTLPLNEEFLNIFDLIPEQKSSQIGGAPDIGWPDMFNSGVLMLAPDKQLASRLQKFIRRQTSIDGADQGVFNQFFNPYCAAQNSSAYEWVRLPFIYNVTMPNYGYQNSPALKYFKSQVKLVHFIGENKPWKGWVSSENNAYHTRWNRLYRDFQEEYGLLQFFEEMSIEPPSAPCGPSAVDDETQVVDWEGLSARIMQDEPERNETYEEGPRSAQPERVFPKNEPVLEVSPKVEPINDTPSRTFPKMETLEPTPDVERIFPNNNSSLESVERVFPREDDRYDNSTPEKLPKDDAPTREIAIASEVPAALPSNDCQRVFPEESVEGLVRPPNIETERQNPASQESNSLDPSGNVSKIGKVLEMIKEESEEASIPETIFQWEKTNYLQEVERTFPD